MTKTPGRDIGASVRARLLRLARSRQEDVQLVLTRYANERLLYRLAVSPYVDRFVLKGAALFTIWTDKPHRATRDLDLLGFGDPDVEHLRSVFTEVLSLAVADDGVCFDVDTLVVDLIGKRQRYGGVRVQFVARVATASLRLQVDIGFGDAVTPAASVVAFPTLLDFPAPRLRAYPRETVVAEKVEAMVQLGIANSRMKDFYDVAALAREFDFEGALLVRAIRATFERRNTPLPTTRPVAFTAEFSDDPTKVTQWSGFLRKSGARDPDNLDGTIAAVWAFLEAPLVAASGEGGTIGRWRAGSGWE